MTATITVLPLDQPLLITRGDDFYFPVAALDKTGGQMNLAGCAVWFTLKTQDDRAPNDLEAVAQYVWQDGGPSSANLTVTNLASGVVTLKLPHILTATLTPGPAYRYDIQVQDANGDETTVIEGALTARGDVTTASTP